MHEVEGGNQFFLADLSGIRIDLSGVGAVDHDIKMRQRVDIYLSERLLGSLLRALREADINGCRKMSVEVTMKKMRSRKMTSVIDDMEKVSRELNERFRATGVGIEN